MILFLSVISFLYSSDIAFSFDFFSHGAGLGSGPERNGSDIRIFYGKPSDYSFSTHVCMTSSELFLYLLLTIS